MLRVSSVTFTVAATPSAPRPQITGEQEAGASFQPAGSEGRVILGLLLGLVAPMYLFQASRDSCLP